MDSSSKTFVDVRFVLFGFDPIEERKVRSRLVDGGGSDAGQYSRDCTHVIVDKIVYDDPVCAAARNDGKILVTGLWVDHSFDVGMPVDASSIMYRPPRGLTGIPGAKSLIICLTGYHRQDREDIMTMVGIMGAQFSKPLVASKVTHLICYRFEGEKYDLAKRTTRIRLVNHRWLEDCLSNWELLPEANYDKSGYELGLMEAEAKDSEDEDEDTTMQQSVGRNMSGNPHNLNIGIPNDGEGFTAEMEALVVRPNLSTTENKLKAATLEDMVSIPSKASGPDQASGSNDLSVLVQNGCKETSTSDNALSDCLPDLQNATAKSPNVENNVASTSKNAKRASGSDVIFYSRKRPRRSSFTNSVEQASGSFDGSTRQSIGNQKAAEACESSCLAEHAMQGMCSTHLETFAKFCESYKEESPSTLPLKRVAAVSAMGIKSQNTDQKTRRCITESLFVQWKGRGFKPHLLQGNNDFLLSNDGCLMDGMVAQNSCSKFSTSKSSNSSEKLESDGLPIQKTLTFEILDKKAPEALAGSANPARVAVEPEEQQDQQHDNQISYLRNGMSATDKVVAEKALGSKLNLNGAANQKGFVYSRRISVNDASLTCLSKGKVTALHEINDAPAVEFEAPNGVALNIDSDVAFKKTDTGDGKTEAPENEDDHKLVNKSNPDELEKAEVAHKELKSEAQTVIINSRDSVLDNAKGLENEKNETELKKAVSREKSSSVKAKRPSSFKAEVKARSNSRVLTKSKDNVSSEGSQDKKDDEAKNRRTNKRKRLLPSKVDSCGSDGMVGSCVEIEKEKSPVFGENQGSSLGKPQVRTTTSESTKTLKNLKKKSEKAQNNMKEEPVWFILSGHRLQRKEFRQVLKHLKGRFCRDSHQWSYQATHFISPELRRTEKLFAAAASGRWILKSDYLSACNEAGSFLPEEPYEWHKKGLSEDGSINLEAPRKWRQQREKTGHGAFYGMHIVVYGDFIIPSLDTLKRVVKAGDGTILATSPPYTRFLGFGIDYAIVSPATRLEDIWIQEFLKHEIPCVLADYLVDFVCKPGYSLDRYVLYNSHTWAEKSFSNLQNKAMEIIGNSTQPGNGDLVDDSSKPSQRIKKGKSSSRDERV